jgi:hypothetical protein
MKKVFLPVLICTPILFSCKTGQVNSLYPSANTVKVTDLGYMPGYKLSTIKTGLSEEKKQEKTNSVGISTDLLFDQPTDIVIQNTSFNYPQHATKEIGINNLPEEKILLYALALKKYALENGYDTNYAFLANMGQLTNTKRLYVINLSAMKIVNKGLVSHGRGKGSSIHVKQYSNVPGSNCTSLGIYKIMTSYTGSYGYSYRLCGLEETNNNALKRNIVLHAMSCIPDRENYAPACVTEGCPAVSPQFLSFMQPIIKSRKSPMLFWVFDSLLQEATVKNENQKSITGSFVVHK